MIFLDFRLLVFAADTDHRTLAGFHLCDCGKCAFRVTLATVD